MHGITPASCLLCIHFLQVTKTHVSSGEVLSKERWHFLASFVVRCCHVTEFWKCWVWFPGRLFKGCWLSWVCPLCPCPLLFFMLPGISNDGSLPSGCFGPQGDPEKGTMLWCGQEPSSWSGTVNLWNTFPWERHISCSSFCLCELKCTVKPNPNWVTSRILGTHVTKSSCPPKHGQFCSLIPSF